MTVFSIPIFGQETHAYNWDEKEDRILKCLQGSATDETVNLWELRELALSPGGLLDPKLRKRAWPILTACHTDLNDPNHKMKKTVAPSRADLQTLRRDVKRTVWDIAEHFSQQNSQELDSSIASNKGDSRRVSFALDHTIEEEDEEGPPGIVRSSTMDSDVPRPPDSPPSSFGLGVSASSALSASFIPQNSSFNGSSSRRARWRKASTHEQKIVSNVVMSVLRMQAEESRFFVDDRYHYFPGLHNLTALVLLNVESPSLTSLVVGKLASFHLRDAMRQDHKLIQKAIQLTFAPLLEKVDPALYARVCANSNHETPSFALSWISAWFASDVGDIAVASRLIDVFLVSHPTMPAYFAVALLVHHRNRILASEPTMKSVNATIRSLSLMATLTAESTKEAGRESALVETEVVISRALRIMKSVPPTALHNISGKTKFADISTIAMMHVDNTPPWFCACKCLTEWGVLRQAKAEREGDEFAYEIFDDDEDDLMMDLTIYAKAVSATGKQTTAPKSSPYVLPRDVLLLVVLVLALLYLPKQAVELLRNQNAIPFQSAIVPVNRNSFSPSLARAGENKTVVVHVVPQHRRYHFNAAEREFGERVMRSMDRSRESFVPALIGPDDDALVAKFGETLFLLSDSGSRYLLPIKQDIHFTNGLCLMLPPVGRRFVCGDGTQKAVKTVARFLDGLLTRPVSPFDDQGFPRML